MVLLLQVVSVGASIICRHEGLVHPKGLSHVILLWCHLEDWAQLCGSLYWFDVVLAKAAVIWSLDRSEHPRRLIYTAGHQRRLSADSRAGMLLIVPWFFSMCLATWLGLLTA